MENSSLAEQLSEMGFEASLIQRVLPLTTSLPEALNLILSFQEEKPLNANEDEGWEDDDAPKYYKMVFFSFRSSWPALTSRWAPAKLPPKWATPCSAPTNRPWTTKNPKKKSTFGNSKASRKLSSKSLRKNNSEVYNKKFKIKLGRKLTYQ